MHFTCFKQVTGFTLGNLEGEVSFEADYVRLFNYQFSSVGFFLSNSRNYGDAQVAEGTRSVTEISHGLLMVASFDSFNAGNTQVAIYNDNGEAVETTLCDVGEEMLVTSSIPVEEVYDLIFESPVYDEAITIACAEVFDENVTALCVGEMGDAVDNMYIEMCLSGGLTPDEFIDLYKLACVSVVPDVDECEFNGEKVLCI